ncbi:MAG: efflux RND transporter periplasmic adaptor subunit [Byssovorax sp.]
MTRDPAPRPAPTPRRYGAGALFLATILSAAIAAPSGYFAALHAHPHGEGAGASSELYQCPMHPTIVQDHPGDCPICGMKLVKVAKAGPKADERKIKFYRSPMDPKQTSPVPAKDEMGMDFIPVYEDEDSAGAAPTVAGLATVDIDAERQQLIGLRTVEVTRGSVSGAWRTVGRVAVDETRVRHVSIKVPIYVEQVHVNFVGKTVKKGAALFSGYSPELLAAQEEYRVALAASKSAAGMGPEFASARSGLADAARRKLALLDMPKAAIDRLEKGGEPLKSITFSSPIAGVVVKKDVVDGMKLDAGAMPYEIVDLSRVWVLADVYEADIRRVHIGMPGKLTLKAYPDRVFEGTAVFLDPLLDPKTRTLKLRLELPNPDGDLKPDMFGDVTLESGKRDALRIPDDAVIDSGTRKVVFVAVGSGKFQPREVVLGDSDGAYVEVVSGLSQGDRVVVRANFLIDSESRLRASLAALPTAPPSSASAPMAPRAPTSSSAAPSAAPAPRPPPAPRAPLPPRSAAPPPDAAAPAPSAQATATAASPAVEYACPMHPEVRDNKPSRCPKCGMTLTPVGHKPE